MDEHYSVLLSLLLHPLSWIFSYFGEEHFIDVDFEYFLTKVYLAGTFSKLIFVVILVTLLPLSLRVYNINACAFLDFALLNICMQEIKCVTYNECTHCLPQHHRLWQTAVAQLAVGRLLLTSSDLDSWMREPVPSDFDASRSSWANDFYPVVSPGGEKSPCYFLLRLTGCAQILYCCLSYNATTLLQYSCTYHGPADTRLHLLRNNTAFHRQFQESQKESNWCQG